MKIALDFDGALVRLHDKTLLFINYKYGTKFTAYDCTQWKFWELPKFAAVGLTKKDFYKACDMVNNHLMEFLDPYDKDTKGVVSSLHVGEPFDNVYVLTAKPRENLPCVRRWLNKHGLENIDAISVDKAIEKFDRDWDVLVDDNPDGAIEAHRRGMRVLRLDSWKEVHHWILNYQNDGTRTYILMAAPWNRFLLKQRPDIFKEGNDASEEEGKAPAASV